MTAPTARTRSSSAPPSAPAPLVPQLLMQYSPRFNARTIGVHVEHLRRHGYVWWGRFYGGSERFDEAGARKRWPHVAELADARAAASEPSLLFVTNYADLHVCKVTRIVLGEDPTGRVRAEALPYYEEQSVPIWFRVEDVRALSYDALTTAVDWFDRRLGVVSGGATRPSGKPYARTYDPHAGVMYEYPIVVEAPSWGELFAPGGPGGGAERWADARDACSPRLVQKAREHLETYLVAGLFGRMTLEGRDLLANGWVESGRVEHDEDVDPSMGFTRIAIAVEHELRELVGALEALAARMKAAGSPLADGFAAEINGARPRDSRGQPVPWSMGPCLEVLRRLASRHRRGLEKEPGLAALVTLFGSLKWLEQTKKLRDAASHRGGAELRPEHRRALVEFFGEKERGKRVLPVVEAREAVGVWGVG